MIKKIQTGITSPKARVFLLLLLCSLGAWLISRLSQTYTHSVAFPITYENTPDSLVLVTPPPAELDARLRANGFQLLRYQLNPKPIRIDLANAGQKGSQLYVAPETCQAILQGQLDDAVALLSVPGDTITFDYQALKSRTVPVRPDVSVNLAQNFMLDGPLRVEPARVHILGPPGEIDTLDFLKTEALRLTDVKESFSRELNIQGTAALPNSKLSQRAVLVSGDVFRFSEVIVEVPIEVSGVPEGVEIRTFPDRVGLLCKGRIEVLKKLDTTDFRVVADYANPDTETGRLPLSLTESPEAVSHMDLLENSVEYIVRRE